MLEYRIHNNNFYKTSKSLPVVKVTFSDLVELLTDYDGNKKDKLMAVCECDDVDKLQDGDFINTINTLILSFGDDTIIQQTFKFNERYQINNVDRKEKSFSFFFDKYIKLDVERIVCGYQYFKPSEFFANRENDNIFLYCKSYHYFDTTDNLNENDEQEIPILFRYTNSDGELKDVTIKFRYYDYATLATSLSAFDDEPELFKILFNVNATVEVLGRTYYNVLPPIPEEDENEAPYGWKRSEYEENGIKYYAWIPKLSEYDLDAMEDIQAIQGSLNDIEVYRNTYLFTDRTFYEFNVERIFANINVPIISWNSSPIREYAIKSGINTTIDKSMMMLAVFFLFPLVIGVNIISAEEPFAYARGVGIVVALACIERADRVQLVLGKFKVEDFHIALDTLGLCGFREYDDTLLILKSKNNLSRVFAVFLSDFGNHGIGKQISSALTERSPRFELNFVFGENFTQLLLLTIRIELDLIDRGHCIKTGNKTVPDFRRHIAYADRTDFACFLRFFHRSPRFVNFSVGLMNQVQVHIIGTELFKRCVY